MKKMMRLGIGMTPNESVDTYVAIAQICENAGIDYVWVADEVPSYPYRDPFVILTAIALNTKKVKLGTHILNPYTRHPSHMAAAMLSLDEISQGRAVIGLGPGGSLTLQPLNIKMWDRPLLAVRNSIEIIRKLTNGDVVDYDGPFWKANRIQMFRKSPLPIYLAARGEMMIKLAGEIADGALMTSPAQLLPAHIKMIKESAQKTGRDLSKLDISNTVRFSISMNEEEAREATKPNIAFMITNLPKSWLPSISVSDAQQEELRDVLFKGGLKEAKKKVTEAMIDSMAIAGTPKTCIKRIKEMMGMGITQIIMSSPFGPDLKEAFNLLGEEVIPKIR